MHPTSVDRATAALAALESASQAGQPFPLVLLDVTMPEIDGFELACRIRERPQLAGATILMLTSNDRMGDSVRCRELGVRSYLIKPVTRAELLVAIRTALGQRRQLPNNQSRPPRVTGAAMRSLRILLAEDNPVNQKLAAALLERAGHEVTIVDNGADAVTAAAAATFDLAFMDIEMPVMGGIDAVAAIRAAESETHGHLPIVAMTAHAMRGDRERCLAAGMDDYVSKPIGHQALVDVIARVVDRRGDLPRPTRDAA